MSDLISCSCGARIRLPEDRANRSFRCPTCKRPVALTIDSRVLSLTPVQSGQDIVCSICRTNVSQDQPCVTCPDCDQAYHVECWSEIGGCGTYGCPQAPALDKSASAAQAPLAAWGDTKRCPACGEEIKAIAVKCRYCGTDFQSVDPMSVADLRRQARSSDALDSTQKMTIALFVASLIGCLAPLIALVGLIYVLPRRAVLAKCGPLYVIMAWTSIVLSCAYSVLLVLFLIGEMR